MLKEIRAVFAPEGRLVAIELGAKRLKLVESAPARGGRAVSRLQYHVLPEDAAEAAREMSAILGPIGLSGSTVTLNIPRHLITVRSVRLPSSDNAEIARIVRMEAMKYIPYTDEEIISGYRVIESFEDGYSLVLVAVTQSSTVTAVTDRLKAAGVASVGMVTLSSEALYMWYRLVRPSDASRTLVANIDDDHIDIDIIDNSRLVFTRGLICDDGSPASDAKLVSEIELSAATYRKESSRGLDRISLTGSPERAEKLKPLLSHQMKVPVDVMDQADGPGVKMPEEARRSGASFVELLGISLGPEPARVNLSSEESRDEERAALSRRSLAATLTLAVLVLALSCGVVAKKFMDKYACLNSIDSEMKKISTDLGRAKKMASDLALVKAEMERRPLAVDVLGEVCQSTPPGIALNMLDYDSGKALAIRGTAPALGDVFGYVTALEASKYFGGVKVKYANKRVVSGRELAEFEIGCLIKKAK